jgi:DNA-directed RNA polymerase subunit RPC12/RpoP
MGMLESWMTSDKVVNLQAVGDELIPVSAQDLAMLKKLTGLTSFNESEYDTVLEKVGQHDYSLEVQYPDDDGEAPMSFNASVEQACPNCQKANVKVVDEEDEDKLMECNDCGSFFTV